MIVRRFTWAVVTLVLALASPPAVFGADAPNAAGHIYRSVGDGIDFPALEGRWRCTTADGKPRLRSYVAETGFLAGRETNGPKSGPGTTFELESFARAGIGRGILAATIEGRSAGALTGDTLALHGTDGKKTFGLTYAVDGTHLRRTVVEGDRTVSDEQCVADVPVSPTPCTEPDQAATTVIPAWPKMPDQALREGTSGTVQVEVMLDAASDLVAAKIYSSPSALLNDDALLTAMRSTYRTAIFHCVTRPAVYIFSVEYDRQ